MPSHTHSFFTTAAASKHLWEQIAGCAEYLSMKYEDVSETGPIEMDNRYHNNTYYVLWAL